MADEESVVMKVKLKVHYTFDVEHKIDCLSRPSESFDVDTVALDDGTSIGVIELRTCLQAVTTSSPELTHFQETDYTVYAYDYSETNTPLVGQGMLSKVVMQEGSANEAMVTGKVTKSLMAKLKKSGEPFLEVKLRLTPIASAMQRGRSGSMSSVGEGQQTQWSSFSQPASQGLDRPQSPADLSRLENVQRTLHEGGPRREFPQNNGYPWAVTSRPTSRPGTPTQLPQYLPPQPSSTHSRHASQPYIFQNYHVRRGSESGYGSGDENFEDGPARKRAKIVPVQKAKRTNLNIELQTSSLRTAAMGASSLRMHQPTPINPTAALQRGFSTEEAVRPPTPMAKPKPTRKPTGNRRGRPPKNRTMENLEPSSPGPRDLHVQRPSNSNVSSPEESRTQQPHESIAGTPVDIPSSPPLIPGQTSATSPELPENIRQTNIVDTNQDSGYFSAQVQSSQPDQTGKTKVITFDGEDLFGDLDPNPFGANESWFDENLCPTNAALDLDMDVDLDFGGPDGENHYTPVFDDDSNFGGPTPQPDSRSLANEGPSPLSFGEDRRRIEPSPVPQSIPTPTLQPTPQSRLTAGTLKPPATNMQFQRPSLPASVQSQFQPVVTDKNGRPVPTLLPRPPGITFQRSQSVLPPIPASDPGTRHLHRANTWAPEGMSDVIMSDVAGPEDGKSKSRKRVGREQTQARLENAIANGGMPPYCTNCGSIDTPAWRRGYVKSFTCSYDSVQTSTESGGMVYKEILESNLNGTVKAWRGWKVEKLPGQPDDEWEQINLCNPCGLFLHKNKRPRPPEKWQKKEVKNTTEKRKRKRPPKPPKSRTNPPRAAAGNLPSELQSDAPEPMSEDSSPADTSVEDGNEDANDTMTIDGNNNGGSQEPELPPIPTITMSAQVSRRTVQWADNQPRQIQSSPVARGTANEPIDLDLTPKPLRRKLFSPGYLEGQTTPVIRVALAENKNFSLLPSFIRRSPRLNKTRDIFSESATANFALVDGYGDGNVDGKENMTPRQLLTHDLEFDEIFEGDHEIMLPPATPTPKRRSERILLRTPGKTPTRDPDDDSSASIPLTLKAKATKQSSSNIAEIFMDSATRKTLSRTTPNSRAPFHSYSNAITPSTKHSQTKTGFTPKSATPSRSSLNFDFPDLPSLKPSSPTSHDDIGNTFSELPTDRLYSTLDDILDTDAHMPSSPPTGGCGGGGWNMHDDFGDIINLQAFENTNWDFMDEQDEAAKLKTPKTPKTHRRASRGFLDIETPGRASLRRSPRRSGRDS